MTVLDALSNALARACGRFGHWLTYVEEGHARCRICGTHSFCSHATSNQIARYLIGTEPNAASNLDSEGRGR